MTVTIETIEAAARRLQGVVIETPLLINRYLNDKLNAKVFIKPECLQHIGAFKFRGAYNRLSQLSDEQRKLGCVAFSSGNHAQAVAYACFKKKISAKIIMPNNAPKVKIINTKMKSKIEKNIIFM